MLDKFSDRRLAEQPRDPVHGVWGKIAQSTERTTLADALVSELESGLSLLTTLPPAVTFFGGARIQPDDPYYKTAVQMGELLAGTGIPPRTGAGPGIMTAVPEGFRRKFCELFGDDGSDVANENGERNGRPQALTQGINIKLPFEQSVNPAIDISLELAHFPTRKLMLYANALGLVIFPGGFGTLDELFEVWRLKSAGTLHYPFVLVGRDFWEPLAGALQRSTLGAGHVTVPEDIFALVTLCDDPEETLRLMTEERQVHGFSEPLPDLGRRIAHELIEGLDYLERLTPAVTVLGGSRLRDNDHIMSDCEEIARHLAEMGVPTRAGGPGSLSVALARGGHRGSPYLPQQAFGMRRHDARNLYGADRVHLVNDRLTHKVLLTEGSLAIVALPGGLGTLDELSSVLCQLQTGKIHSRPVVLFGTDFWQPLWGALKTQMLDGKRRTVSEQDLNLVTLTDDPRHAVDLCLAATESAVSAA
ncbi:MAG: LOG family protein [Candidatus Binatia bacterium]